MQWISVEDGVPGNDFDSVLALWVCNESGYVFSFTCECYFELRVYDGIEFPVFFLERVDDNIDETINELEDKLIRGDYKVSHWMPLPPDPWLAKAIGEDE